MVAIYTRNVHGVVTEYDSIEEALKDFTSYYGYRLSFSTDELTLHIHRDELPLVPMNENMEQLFKTYEAKISYAERN
jgi:hypothetical protein